MFNAAILLVVGAVLAIISGAITQWMTYWIKTGHERRSLAQAFAGEIGAIMDIVKRRGYVENLRKLIPQVESHQVAIPFKFSIRQNYFCVYESNIDRVGQLPGDLPREVARFYTFAKSVIEDVTNNDVTDSGDAAVCLYYLKELEGLFSELGEMGPRLVDQLKAVPGPQLPRWLRWIPLSQYSGCDAAESE